MSEGLEPQPGAFGAAQAGTPTEVASGARMDTQGAVPTDFAGRAPGAEGSAEAGFREQLLSRGREAVNRGPWRAVFVGLLLGIAFGRQTRPKITMVREVYVEPAMTRSQEALFGTLLAMAGACRMAWRSTSLKTHDALDNARLYSKPLAKAARRATHRAKRKLHIGQTSFFWR